VRDYSCATLGLCVCWWCCKCFCLLGLLVLLRMGAGLGSTAAMGAIVAVSEDRLCRSCPVLQGPDGLSLTQGISCCQRGGRHRLTWKLHGTI
jgi:hypothetical protein